MKDGPPSSAGENERFEATPKSEPSLSRASRAAADAASPRSSQPPGRIKGRTPGHDGEGQETTAATPSIAVDPVAKVVWQEHVQRVTFERWSEFDALTVRLVRHDQMIELLKLGESVADEQQAEAIERSEGLPVDDAWR